MRWRVTGIPSDIKKRARDAAGVAGLPLGPWLERAIRHDLTGAAFKAPALAGADTERASEVAATSTMEPATEAASDAQPPSGDVTSNVVVDMATNDAPTQILPEKAQKRGMSHAHRIGAIGAALFLAAGIGAIAWLKQPATVAPAPPQTATTQSGAEAPASPPEAVAPAQPAPPPDSAPPSTPPAQPPSPQASRGASTPSPATPAPGAAARPPQPTQPQTLSEIISDLNRDALNGDAAAQHDLGLAYVNGRGVPQNYEIAAGWFEKAANAGSERAQFNLAVLYENGLGVPQDFERAFKLYQAAAEQGFGPAQHNVGVAYVHGRGTERDYRAAALWFRRAADQGIASAQYNLGMIYEKGLAGPPDPQTAYGWYRRAAASGSEAAVARLAAMEGRVASAPAEGQAGKPAKPTRAEIVEIQQLLNLLSFDVGSPDGKIGPTTRSAIRQYEQIAGLKVTGEATVALLLHLRQVTAMMDGMAR